MQMHRVRLGTGVFDHEADGLVRTIVVDIPQRIEVEFAIVDVKQHWVVVVDTEGASSHVPNNVSAVRLEFHRHDLSDAGFTCLDRVHRNSVLQRVVAAVAIVSVRAC